MRHIIMGAAGAALAFCVFAPPAALADQCTEKLQCNDPGFPECHFNPSRSEWKCTGRGVVFCAAMTRSYTCAAGQQCNGDGSTQPYCR